MNDKQIKIKIDGSDIICQSKDNIVQAASRAGITIPTLCYNDKCKPGTTCMICLVKIEGQKGYSPACSTIVSDNMVITSNSPEITRLRQSGLELLLSEHLGDCMGPCQVACPANMDIPAMLRAVSKGEMRQAAEIVLADIPLAAILGHVCPGPCEKICRHRSISQAIPICKIKGDVGQYALENNIKASIENDSSLNAKTVAIIGSGPAGLTSGYYLSLYGCKVTIFDKDSAAGGGLKEIPADILPAQILEAETAVAINLAEFQNKEIGKDISLNELAASYDAIILATGPNTSSSIAKWLDSESEAIIDKETLQISLGDKKLNIFASGGINQPGKMSVRAVGQGHQAANIVRDFLINNQISVPPKPFNTRIGKMTETELSSMIELRNAIDKANDNSKDNPTAKDCLHCDCRASESCKLRELSSELGAGASEYKLSQRKEYAVELSSCNGLIYEPGKCIKCGLCIEISKKQPEKALSFTARGYETKVVTPSNITFADLKPETIAEIVEVCPTAAMSFNDKR